MNKLKYVLDCSVVSKGKESDGITSSLYSFCTSSSKNDTGTKLTIINKTIENSINKNIRLKKVKIFKFVALPL